MAVIACHQARQFAVIVGYTVALAKSFDKHEAPLLMAGVVRPVFFWGEALAQIMHQCSEADAGVLTEPGRLLQDQEYMQPRVDLGMVLGGLRHTEQPLELRKERA